MKQLNNLSLAVFITLLSAACASTGPVAAPIKEDKVAESKSQAYMDSMMGVAASEARGVCAMASGTENWRELVQRANGCVFDKNWAKLEQLAAVIAKKDVDSPWGAYYFSLAAEAHGDFTRALWMVELAQKKAGGRAGLFLYQRGRVFLAMKETAKSISDLEQAVSRDPNLVDAHLYLGQIYQRDQQLDKASSHYVSALGLDSKSYAALTGLAEIKIRQGAGADAADSYQKAASLYPQQLQPWIRLAYVYETLQKSPTQALNTYRTLKSGLESGSIKGRADFDLTAKIKALEKAVQPTDQSTGQARVPAQANGNAESLVPQKRSKK